MLRLPYLLSRGNLITARENPPYSYGSQIKLPQREEPNKLNPDEGINKSYNQQRHIPRTRAAIMKGGRQGGGNNVKVRILAAKITGQRNGKTGQRLRRRKSNASQRSAYLTDRKKRERERYGLLRLLIGGEAPRRTAH